MEQNLRSSSPLTAGVSCAQFARSRTLLVLQQQKILHLRFFLELQGIENPRPEGES
jgi:hypothetical protein